MTEEEGDLLHNLSNQYWCDFSELVNLTLLSVPAHLRDLLEEKLQESSSVYGRNDVKTHLKEATHPLHANSRAVPNLFRAGRC